MDNQLANLHQRKQNKKAKSKKKPFKVVYISNPMKVKTNVSQFRSLVQKLTGQDAGLPDPTKFTHTDDVGSNQTVQDLDDPKVVVDDHRHAHEIPVLDSSHEQSEVSDFSFEPFDDFFMP